VPGPQLRGVHGGAGDSAGVGGAGVLLLWVLVLVLQEIGVEHYQLHYQLDYQLHYQLHYYLL